MRKFILNLLSVVAWIYQAVCVLSIVMSVVVTGFMIFVVSQPDIRTEVQKGFHQEIGVSMSNSTMWWITVSLFGFMFVGFFAQFFICHYARAIIKNIKKEIYFALNTMQYLKRLLISVAVYVGFTVVYYIIIFCNFATFSAMSKRYAGDVTSNFLYPSSITNGLLFLAVLYVVYLVFKYGMKVQEDADSII